MRYNASCAYVLTISRNITARPSSTKPRITPTISFITTRLAHSIYYYQKRRCRSAAAPMEEDRSYEAALARLASLQSNQAVTSLFTQPTPTPAPAPAPAGATGLNALAIPEMLAWLRRAGGLTPQVLADGRDGRPGLRCIHVAGTKGKGSVCAFLTAILTEVSAREAKEEEGGGGGGVVGRVGTYTSPHLVSVRERIMLDGAPIPRPLFARYFFEVWDALTEAARAELASTSAPAELSAHSEEELRGPATKPFYFRFLTLVALHAFLREGVRSAVVECGIGAEHDPTGALPAAAVTASAVAQLGLDHVAMLGATVPEIAWHKAGVCKPGRRCFARKLDGEGEGEGEEVMAVLRRRAAEKGAELVELDDAAVRAWGGVRGDGASLEGEFQVFNQALAVCAAREHLRVLREEKSASASASSSSSGQQQQKKPLDSPAAAAATADSWLRDLPPGFEEGLRKARLRGRCETVLDDSGRVTWFLDGAHTAESLEEVAKWFVSKQQKQKQKQGKRQKRVLIFNQQERGAAKMLRGLLGSIERFSEPEPGARAGGVFDLAIFTRNDVQPRVTGSGEPERDLSVQHAAAEAMRELSPETKEKIAVVDNVSEAVGRARKLADGEVQTHGDGSDAAVLVTGSLYLVGAVLRTLEPDAET